VDVRDQTFSERLKIDGVGVQRRGSVGIVYQGEQKMLQRREFVRSFTRVRLGSMQRQFELAGEACRPSRTCARRRRHVCAGGMHSATNLGGECIPIGHAEQFGDQFQTLAGGDVEASGSEAGAQGMRHSFSVAEVAHGLVLCLNENRAPVLALLTRCSGKGAVRGRCDTFTIPKRVQAAGRIHP
jgi:hypothetical protein